MKFLPTSLRDSKRIPLPGNEVHAVLAYAYSRLWGDPTPHWQSQQPKPKDPEPRFTNLGRTATPEKRGWFAALIAAVVKFFKEMFGLQTWDNYTPPIESTVELQEEETTEEPVDTRPPPGRVKPIGRVYWTGRFRKIHGTNMLVDESGLLPSQSLDALFFPGHIDEVLQISRDFDDILNDPPVVSPPAGHQGSDGDDGSDLRAEYEVTLHRLLGKLTEMLKSAKTESISLPLVIGGSTPEAIAQSAGSLIEGQASPVLRSQLADSTDSEIERFNNDERISASLQLRNLSTGTIQRLGTGLHSLAETRHESLNVVLAKHLDELSRYYDFPMFDLYCPVCFSRRMEDAGISINDPTARLDSVDSQGLLAAENALRSSKLALQIDNRWHCPMCDWQIEFDRPPSDYDSGLDSPRHMNRVFSDLVVPLRDVLWEEKHDQRVRIIGEKEAERRANQNDEYNELSEPKNQFSMDRRQIRGNVDSLRDTATASGASLLSLINAFAELEMLNETEAEQFRERISRKEESYSSTIQYLVEQLGKVEGELDARVEDSRDRRAPIIDPDFKIRGPESYQSLEVVHGLLDASSTPQSLPESSAVNDA